MWCRSVTGVGVALSLVMGVGSDMIQAQASRPTTLAPSTFRDAEKYLVGVWTYVGRGISNFNKSRFYWCRLVVFEDGMYEFYQAQPVDDDWGKPKTRGLWAGFTGKYWDTGQRYFAFRFITSDTSETAVTTDNFFAKDPDLFIKEGRLVLTVGDFIKADFEKLDAIPFSK